MLEDIENEEVIMFLDPSSRTGVSIFKVNLLKKDYKQIYSDEINTSLNKFKNSRISVGNPARHNFIYEEIKSLITSYKVEYVIIEKWVAPSGKINRETIATHGATYGAIFAALGSWEVEKYLKQIINYDQQKRYEVFEKYEYEKPTSTIKRKDGSSYQTKRWDTKTNKKIAIELSKKFKLNCIYEGKITNKESDNIADANLYFIYWWTIINGEKMK